MGYKTIELDIIKQLFNILNEKDAKEFLGSVKNRDKNIKNINTHKVSCCPHCKFDESTKNGSKNGSQHYICKRCGKTFTDTNQTILFSSKKDISVWQKYIQCMIEKYSLRKTAEICGISLSTAFIWRHKILDALQNMMNEVELDGVVEADETFMTLSFKGNHKSFNLPCLAKHRDESATRFGLSKKQVYITSAINLNGLSIVKISNIGRPKLIDLQKILDKKIAINNLLFTDNFNAYLKFLNDISLDHIRIPQNKHKLGNFNVQSINNSKLKTMITYNFKGVSTKYLDNYLVYNNFVDFTKNSKNGKNIILCDFIQKIERVSLVRDISNRAIITLAS